MLVAAVVLDGVPENVALGLRGGEYAGTMFLAIVLSNLPEAIVGVTLAVAGGMGRLRVVGIWAAAAAL